MHSRSKTKTLSRVSVYICMPEHVTAEPQQVSHIRQPALQAACRMQHQVAGGLPYAASGCQKLSNPAIWQWRPLTAHEMACSNRLQPGTLCTSEQSMTTPNDITPHLQARASDCSSIANPLARHQAPSGTHLWSPSPAFRSA